MNDRTRFGPVISQFRKEKGLSQKKLAACIIALCDAAQRGPSRPWKNKKGLIAFLKSL